MTDHHTDDVLKDLEAALAVTPSQEFAEGVRARVRSESARRRAWPVWAMAGLAAAAVIVVAFAAWPHREESPAAVAVTASRAPEPVAPAPVVTRAAPAVSADPVVPIARPRAARDAPRRAAAPEVLVPRDQALALQVLVTGLNNGTIDAASLATPPPDASVPLAPAAKIEIVPIVIPPIDVRAPGASGGEPVGGIR